MRRLTVDLGALGVVLLLGSWPVAPAVAAPLPAAAQAQYLRGSQLYRQQRFAQAAQAFSAAYAQYPSSRLLYDIGQAQRKAGKASDAVTAYESFLTAETQLTPNTRGGVLAYIADLQRQLKRPVTVTGQKPKVMPDLLDPAQGLPPSAAAAAVKAAPAPVAITVATSPSAAAPVAALAAPPADATAKTSVSGAAPTVAAAAVPAAAPAAPVAVGMAPAAPVAESSVAAVALAVPPAVPVTVAAAPVAAEAPAPGLQAGGAVAVAPPTGLPESTAAELAPAVAPPAVSLPRERSLESGPMRVLPGRWTVQDLKTGYTLRRVLCLGPDVFAIGESGTYLVALAKQTQFLPIKTGLPSWLSAVFAPGSELLMGGDGGLLLRRMGGYLKPVPSGIKGTIFGLGGSSSEWFAVGEGGAASRSSGAGFVAVPTDTRSALFGVVAVEGSVFAVGAGGTIQRYIRVDDRFTAMASSTRALLYAAWGDRASNVYAVGSGGTLLHFDGSSWQSIATDTKQSLLDIWGSGPQDIYVVGSGGLVLHFDGKTWARVETGTRANLYGVHGRGPGDVFAVGEGGVVLHYQR